MGGTCESHVEQVQVVDRILKVLLKVVGLIDRTHHLLLTIVDRRDRQIAERRLLRTAPEDITALLLQLPVTKRTDHMVELQSLRLMDRDQTDAIDHVALDRLATERLIPFIQERVDVRRVLVDKRCQLVIEGTYIGTLILERLQVEDGIETLCEIIERQR